MESYKDNSEKIVGKSIKELSIGEMNEIYGGVDADERSIISATLAIAKTSSKPCLAGIGTAITGIVSHNKDCLG